MKNEFVKKPHRTTVYLSSEHHSLTEENSMNLSEFVREKLDEYFSLPDNINQIKQNKIIELKEIEKQELILKERKKILQKEIKKLNIIIKDNEKIDNFIKKIKVSRAAYGLLKQAKEKNEKGTFPRTEFEDYKNNFEPNIKTEDFFKKIKELPE